MKKKNKVYIVTRGDYSSYRILGVFSDKKLADETASKLKARVEVWDLNPNEANLRKGYTFYMVRIGKTTSDVIEVFKYEEIGEEVTDSIRPSSVRNSKHLICKVWAKDEQHAAKIAMEMRTRYLLSHGLIGQDNLVTVF